MPARSERTRTRSTAFQRWHREELPGWWEAVDFDLVLRCRLCHGPLALVEDTTSLGKRDEHMRTQITAARRLRVPFVVVVYEADTDDRLITFRWRMAWPSQSHWRSAEDWRRWELLVRDNHSCEQAAA
mgnify:CR=1 FL=1